MGQHAHFGQLQETDVAGLYDLNDELLNRAPIHPSDQLIYGDLISPIPRVFTQGTLAGVSGTILACATKASGARTGINAVRIASSVAASGSGLLRVGVYLGAPTALTKVSEGSLAAASVPNGGMNLTIPTFDVAAGEWVTVMVLPSFATTQPTFRVSGFNPPSALLNPGIRIWATATGQGTTLPATANINASPYGAPATGPLWWALARN